MFCLNKTISFLSADWVDVANDLFSKCHINLKLRKLTDCDANVFIALYENILGEKVPGKSKLQIYQMSYDWLIKCFNKQFLFWLFFKAKMSNILSVVQICCSCLSYAVIISLSCCSYKKSCIMTSPDIYIPRDYSINIAKIIRVMDEN